MNYQYGEKMLLRVLDEIEFWKRQEAEHTVVIRQITPGLEQEFVQLLQQWQQAFEQTEGMAVKFIEAIVRSNYRITPEQEEQIYHFVRFAIDQSQKFILLLNQIEDESEAVRHNPVAAVVIHHIRRESEYFIGVVQAFLSGQK